MITTIRKNQKWLLIFVSVFVIIAFAWLYNDTQIDQLGADRVVRIYDREVSSVEVQRRARMFNLTVALGLFDFVEALAGPVMDRDQMVENFVMNSFVLEREAALLQLQPTARQVAEVVRSLPVFIADGRFDIQKFAEFGERQLSPAGFTELQIEEAVADSLRVAAIRRMLAGTVAVSDLEVRSLFERANRVIETEAVFFDAADLIPGVEVPEDEIVQYFNERGATLNTSEKRSVRFVRFGLSEGQRELDGRDRISALQTLANRAADFADILMVEDADFEAAVAGLEGVDAGVTPLFSREEPAGPVRAAPNAGDLVFSLSVDLRASDPVQIDDGFLVFYLDEIEPSRPLTLDESRGQIVEFLTEQKARELLAARVDAAREAILSGMSDRASFADAVRSAGFEPVVFEGFSLSRPDMEIPEWPTVVRAAAEMQPGEVSEPISTMTGKMLLYVTAWQAVDEEDFREQSGQVREQLLAEKQALAFYLWMSARAREANITPL